MHSISEVGTNVPAFLAKLWKLVEDPTTNGLISWSANGSSFLIRNQAQFSRELLPLYYKHNNLASFIRQLNMYGFHKITSVESGGLKVDKDEMEFAHKYFLRGHPYLLENIKRKIPTGGVSSGSSSHSPTGNVKPEIVSRVLQDVRQMKGRQETLDSRFNAMKRENEALWRELALLRQKHMKQQQIVNKLIQFLVTLVQPNRGLGIKRTYPLMLNDTPNRNTHSNSRHGVSQPKVAKINVISDVMAHEELSPKGPVIHELDNNVEYILPDDSYDEELSGVEFVCGRDDEIGGAKLSAYTGSNVPLGTLKTENGRRNQGQPESQEAGAEASDIPVQLNKELDSVVPLVHSPYSSLGNLDSMPSSPLYAETDTTAVNQEEGTKAADSELQVNVPESCLLPSVEYPLSPEILMGSIDPSVVSPAPNQVSKKKGQGTFRNSKSGAKGKISSGKKLARATNNRKTKKSGALSGKDSEMEIISHELYPEIHLEEGNTSVNEEAAKLLDSVVGSEELNEENAEVDVESAGLNEDTENKDDYNMALACTLGSSGGERDNSSDKNIREELDMHLDTMQSELDMLKDMLMKGNVAPGAGVTGGEGDILSGVGGLEGYCLDASALLGVCPASLGHLLDPAVSEGGGHILSKLFGSDDPVPFGVSSEDSSGNLKENPDLLVTGNELATYNPTLLDLVEDDDNSQLLEWCDAASSCSKDELCPDSDLGTPAPEVKRRDPNAGKVEAKRSEKDSSKSLSVQANDSQVKKVQVNFRS